MPLSDYQEGFLDDLLSGTSSIEDAIAPAFKHRLNIYRNNVNVGLKSYLADVFPAVKALVGDAFFNSFCQRFLTSHPPHSGDLHRYGEPFADALASFPALAEQAFVDDVARLEWAYHRAYYAPDGTPLVMPDDPNHLLTQHASLHPSVALIQSPYPIDELWRQSRPDHKGEFTVRLEDGASSLLVLRTISGVTVQRLEPAALHCLRSIEGGLAFGPAIESAMALEGAEQLTPFLSHCFNQRLFCQPE
ncbi:HvfC/BufC N-terminal domain-containing protein [Saccharospirillum salsuginis]|uniref:DUF2063 domain-containing protein n=1 Tax=Saccharospirillum salsuginis TaxID=418750 RepID=A0A918JZN7_9GAMM|nr:DNA-binding domain-containing protein [Saccharospirillum salsuginis]GGX38239.1 DUF2063 domain-containing protein [Saccharospirillum salsuginis]